MDQSPRCHSAGVHMPFVPEYSQRSPLACLPHVRHNMYNYNINNTSNNNNSNNKINHNSNKHDNKNVTHVTIVNEASMSLYSEPKNWTRHLSLSALNHSYAKIISVRAYAQSTY